MTPDRRVRVADLGPSDPAVRKVWVPAPAPLLLMGEDRDPQDVYVWRRAARVAVEKAGVPRLTGARVTCEIVSSAADPDLPAHEMTALQGRLLATAKACQDGVVDVCGEITGPAAVTMGCREPSPGVRLHITGKPS